MRASLIDLPALATAPASTGQDTWLDLDVAATVAITSVTALKLPTVPGRALDPAYS